MVALKLGRLGNSVGATFPKETLARMNVSAGDILYLTEAPGGFRLTPYDPEFEHQMSTAERVMKKRRNMLRELSKR